MKHLVIANWKMNPGSIEEALKLAKAEDISQAVIAPSTLHFLQVGKSLRRATLAAQDIDPITDPSGPYTGSVSAGMIKRAGARYVIIGHSERRTRLEESDERIAKKVEAAFLSGLTPILCVGEPLTVREKGYLAVREYIASQLATGLEYLQGKAGKIIIAYEPIWAISTNGAHGTDDPEGAGETIQYIKAFLSESMKQWAQFKVLGIYGGSINAQNVMPFMKERSIDGFLVGGASLKPKEFSKIVEICNQ